MHVDIADFFKLFVAVHGRIDDRVVDEGDLLVDLLVPTPGVVIEWLVEIRIGAQRGKESGLVIRARPIQP